MDQICQSYTEFGFSLLRKCRDEKPLGNLFFSPTSISIALTMAATGCKENTRREIHEALNLQNFTDENLLAAQEKLYEITNSPGCKLSIANGLFVENNYKVLQDYLETLSHYFKAECKRMDFKVNSDASVNHINEWAKNKTNGKIENLIPKDAVNADTALILVNAIHFKGLWKTPFKIESTLKQDFHISPSEKIEVDMMNISTDFKSVTSAELDCRCLLLPYTDGPITCLLLLPNEITGLKTIEEKLNANLLGNINKTFLNAYEAKVALSLPKFKITENLQLNDLLKSMGIKDVFIEGVADLTGISENRDLYVSNVLHKACLEVNEEGTEAAAATAVIMVSYCMVYPEEFIFDRPFMVVIQDATNNSVLFLGSIREI